MSKMNFSWQIKLLLLLIFITPFAILFWAVMGKDIINPKTHEETFLEFERKSEFSGKIDGLFRLKMSHNTLTLQAKDKVFYVPAKWEEKFKIGDSISKKEGEVIVKHYRDGKLLEILDYRDIAKGMK